MIRALLLSTMLIVLTNVAIANEIYIDQVGDSLDLDITQDGEDNEFGDSTTDVTLEGDDMTFKITQTGDTNIINAVIKAKLIQAHGNSLATTTELTCCVVVLA